MWCWQRIKEDATGKGRCPACRNPYGDKAYSFTPPDPEEYVGFMSCPHWANSVAREAAEKKKREKEQKQSMTNSRKHLWNIRVIQRNLVYVIGLSVAIAKDEVWGLILLLCWFGRFCVNQHISDVLAKSWKLLSIVIICIMHRQLEVQP